MTGTYFDQLLLFRGLTPAQHGLLQPLFKPFDAPQSTLIFGQGEPAEYLYVVVEGEVVVRFKPDDGPDLTVARIRADGVVGWSAALGSPTYTSSAVCEVDCCLLRVKGSDLRELCEQQPETGAIILERLAAIIAERLRNTHGHVMTLLEQGLRVDVRNH